MTTKLKRILISGFRGIPGKLPLDFLGGSECRSMLLYGKNGTGKSSISDAWEWLTTGKIDHLAREGAKESSYPNMGAKPGEVFVEAEFSNASLGVVRLAYNHKRITKPVATGPLDAVRSMIKHACHIRYGDLTRFVYLTKAERYDSLARLMGFVPQMEYQKALRRVEGQLEKEVARLEQLEIAGTSRLVEHFAGSEENGSRLAQISDIAISGGYGMVKSLTDADKLIEKLQKEVEQDPRAVKLASHKILQSALEACTPPALIPSDLGVLSSAVGHLVSVRSDEAVDQLRIPFLQSADRLIQATGETGVCPLCGKEFEGDLHEHVMAELGKLKYLKELLEALTESKSAVTEPLATYSSILQAFEKALGSTQPGVEEASIDAFKAAASILDQCVERIRTLATFDSSALPHGLVSLLKEQEVALTSAINSVEKAKTELLIQSKNRSTALENDPERVKLVEAARFVREGVKLIREHESANRQWREAEAVLTTYRATVDRYVSACLVDVQERFDLISDQVKKCFEMLEKHTPSLGEPRLKLLPDQDRSVVLEVLFRGENIQPAYKYLSESQLNSFGLAVFLASATHFNQECRLLILDDVVNSFDAYKRPLLIDLLKECFEDRQILLMTHDRFWRDNLVRHLPGWKRTEFINYKPGQGPTVRPGMSKLEQVEDDLAKDRPESAARELSDHIDNVLQDVCELFEVELKFNRRNEYTMDTLLDRLRVRLSRKLGSDHTVTRDVTALFEANAYRNWVSHCKSPESPIHVDEVREVLDTWRRIEKAVTCQDPACAEVLSWDSKSRFVCGCGATILEKLRAMETES
jgi:DNA repair exonuclease SbcCD ATPase subunit